MDTFRIAVSSMALDAKLEYGSPMWRSFNASFENKEIDLWGLAEAVYMGHPITTWHKNRWRHGDNFLLGQHIGLDFDSGDEKSSLDHLKCDPFVEQYASLIYTTPSHTEENPRSRVIFLLDQPIMQPKNYTMAATALLWIFGTADRQCKDPARFFYGSIDCDLWVSDHVLPIALVKDVIQLYHKTGRAAKRQTSTRIDTSDAAVKELQKALDAIPPWQIDYGEWVSVLMALHHSLPESIALPLAESWAQGEDGEVERKWKSFERNNGDKVGLGSVFHLAKRFGYQRSVMQ